MAGEANVAVLPTVEQVGALRGSLGDADISKESVRRCYYDDDTWRDPQELKADARWW